LICVAAVCLCASAAEFSHRRHLALRLACAKCHAAAATSTKAADNLLPKPAVCAECHDDGRIPRAAPSATFVSKFNHALHLKMGNLAPVIASAIDHGTYLSKPGALRQQLGSTNPCEACHRGLQQSDQVSMANFPRMADCLVCHNQIDPPFSCEKCHSTGPHLQPASHTANFIDTHSSGKLNIDKSTCAVCHGRSFTCQGCH
jgi:hypothetical protein